MIINLIFAFVLIVLFILSAIVSASELAYFSLSPGDIETLENSNASNDKLILKLRQNPDRLLSTILIANNLVNVSIVILSSYFIYRLFDFEGHPMLLFFVETVLITFLLLLFGENLPKIYAANYTLRFARMSAGFLFVCEKLLWPLSWLLVKPSNHISKLEKHSAQNISMDDISQAYDLTADAIEEDKELLEGIIKFGNISAASAMTPRVDVISLDITDSFAEVLRVINTAGYSRIPVCKDDLDEIHGILYIKDILAHLGEEDFHWQSVIRKAYFVPQTKHINVLLEDFQKNKIHIAVVVDEFGGTAGIITMEDIWEENVGDIDDEYDETDHHLYAKLGDNNYLFDAKILLADFFKIEGIDRADFEKEIGDAETLAGLILEMKDEIPEQEEVFDYKKYRFTIVSADKRRIKTIKLTIKPNENAE
ncbi:MAG: gliding motility-associated protein GldE [Paludibacteraceae bacterium]|nr:gliding motility-associated protein GldE [Paludibacteraceae bacterium]